MCDGPVTTGGTSETARFAVPDGPFRRSRREVPKGQIAWRPDSAMVVMARSTA